MLITDRVRELIFTGIGIVAALAVATSVIYYFRLDAAMERIGKQDVMYQEIAKANTRNAETISKLQVDLATAHKTAQDLLTLQLRNGQMNQRTEDYLRKLVQSNDEIKSLFSVRLPDAIRGLFQNTGTSRVPEDREHASGISADGHPTKPDASR